MLSAAQPFLLAAEAPPPPPVGRLAPRDYQTNGIDDARRILAEGVRALLLVMATGGGKTVVAALIALGALAKGKRVLFVGPRREIIAQAFWKLVEAGVPELDLGVIMANGVIPHPATQQPYSARRPMAPCQVASLQTLNNRRLPPADVVFIDEAHHATSETWAKVIRHYLEAGAKVVGLTATPCRADGRGLRIFERLHVIATFRELAARGFLIVPRVFTSPKQADLAGVKVSDSGDYNQAQLAERMDKRELVGDVVEHYLRLGPGRRGVIFAASVEHSRHLAKAFTEAGVPAGHIDGTTKAEERDLVLAQLRRGEIQVICNFGCLTEGWDEPTISYVALVRPTKSLSLALQMFGRGLRPHASKADVVVADHAGVVHAHGFPQDDREWDLEGIAKRPASTSCRTCPKCYASFTPGTAVCSECGYVWPPAERDEPEQVDGELVEASETDTPRPPSVSDRMTAYAAILADAWARGRKVGWARHTYHEKFGMWPRGARAKDLERQYLKPAPVVAPPVADPTPPVQAQLAAVEAVPAPALAPPVRARRIDLASLLAQRPPVAAPRPAEEVEAWSL